MDELIKQGQWWWMLIPLGTGIFALVGSWLGSRLGKDNEHAQWRRNQKQVEYARYLDAVEDLNTALARIRWELEPYSSGVSAVDGMDEAHDRLVKATARLFLVAPGEIIVAADELKSKFGALMRTTNENLKRQDEASGSAWDVESSRARRARNDLMLLIRQDLGLTHQSWAEARGMKTISKLMRRRDEKRIAASAAVISRTTAPVARRDRSRGRGNILATSDSKTGPNSVI